MGMGPLAVVGLGDTALGMSIAGFFDQLSKLFHG
jgi:vacuolar-type H+-ATPase subunit F/Vma7